MMPLTVAGIDVSKNTLDVCLLPSRAYQRLPYDDAGLSHLSAWLRAASVQRVVLEATGGLEMAVAQRLHLAGLSVHRINPERICGFRKSLGIQGKTDRLDAAVIARFGLIMDLPDRKWPTPAEHMIKELAARRRQLVEMIAAEKNRLKQAGEPGIQENIRLAIKALGELRHVIEAQLMAAIAATPEAWRRYRLLLSIPGFGQVVASTLITDLPELGEVDRHAIASLAGVAPHPQQSGSSLDRHRLRGGRACVRSVLYMAALSASRAHPRIRADYLAMLARGKAPKQALIAIARKLVTIANQILRSNQPWSDTLPLPPKEREA